MQHVELCHPENGESPFIATQNKAGRRPFPEDDSGSASTTDAPSEDDEEYVECLHGCGEAVTITELPNHMELHEDEGTAFDEAEPHNPNGSIFLHGGKAPLPGLQNQFSVDLPDALHNYTAKSTPDITLERRPRHRKHREYQGGSNWKNFLLGVSAKPSSSPSSSSSSKPRAKTAKAKLATVRRLGKNELGPHAHEEQMPAWLRMQLERGAKISVANEIGSNGQLIRVETVANETRGTMRVIAQLCEQDQSVEQIYLCHPDVQHVVKMSGEGGFCGYRNIQMIVSFIQATRSPGYEQFPGRIPSILHLQDMIEAAWDQGINSTGRVETGGIKGTRKYIGTPEAQALMISLGIGCDASAFIQNNQAPTHELIMEAVEDYFLGGAVADRSAKVCRTSLPPLYFQHPGHSLTIVGFERRKSGKCNLLVFDPMFKPSPGVCRLVGANFRTGRPERLLKAYRRDDVYLRKYKSFEILKLTSRLPPGAGWRA
ncbi:MAG: hypothetical protein FRX48_04255 [Lasallia pustulata]|uniref:UFSP1/2/DUB catalytic domain-containing protein n=1 Tax=Lasallia pustulata TaxID=136370 RepID=A0A5M8PSU2_9LECA|nr:MAG: hypothetical protein FRX48_04255 [Lasallia pustulata]